MKKLTVQQASEKYGSSVRAALLIDMTNVFAEEAWLRMAEISDLFGFCSSPVHDTGIARQILDVLGEKGKNDIFFAQIFDAVQEVFSLNDLKELAESDAYSPNMHLAYERLEKYFAEKAEDEEKRAQEYLSVYDAESYKIIFGELKDTCPEPPKSKRVWLDPCDERRLTDRTKIQELYRD